MTNAVATRFLFSGATRRRRDVVMARREDGDLDMVSISIPISILCRGPHHMPPRVGGILSSTGSSWVVREMTLSFSALLFFDPSFFSGLVPR